MHVSAQPPVGTTLAINSNALTTVQMSWLQVKQLGTDTVGGLFYKKFFQLEPTAKALFPMSVRLRYKDWDTDEEEGEDPTNSPALRKLWAKFVTVVGSAVAGIQDCSKLVPSLQQLGIRHVAYGLKPEYFNLAGKVLIEVLAEWLGESFTKEVENAWVMVSGFMVATMFAGFTSACSDIHAKELQLGFLNSTKDLSSTPASTVGSTITDGVSMTSRQVTPVEKDVDYGKEAYEVPDDLPTILTSDRFSQLEEKLQQSSPFP